LPRLSLELEAIWQIVTLQTSVLAQRETFSGALFMTQVGRGDTCHKTKQWQVFISWHQCVQIARAARYYRRQLQGIYKKIPGNFFSFKNATFLFFFDPGLETPALANFGE
jgi:hypothetical protein